MFIVLSEEFYFETLVRLVRLNNTANLLQMPGRLFDASLCLTRADRALESAPSLLMDKVKLPEKPAHVLTKCPVQTLSVYGCKMLRTHKHLWLVVSIVHTSP